MPYTTNKGFQQAPTFADWNEYGIYDNEPMYARSESGNQANYDNFINQQARWQAEGNVDKYNQNLVSHGLYQEVPASEQHAYEMYAQQMADEAARQGRIAQGTRAIDQQFSGFNDAYYNNVANAYSDWATPQLATQYDDNTRQLAFALARAGTTNSSTAAKKQADLQRMYDEGKAKLTNTGLGYASQAREAVANQKANMYAQLNATSGAENAASQAAAQASLGANALRNEQPIYDTLGDFFYGLTPGIGQGLANAGTSAVGGYQNAGGPAVNDIGRAGNETVR